MAEQLPAETWHTFVMPSRVETPRLRLRCYEPADAPVLKAAIDENLEHLLPWIPWAQFEPTPLESVVTRIAGFAEQFQNGPNWGFGIFDRDETTLLGGIGFHARIGPRALEVGYWLAAKATGRGFATEAVDALTRLAFSFPEIDRLEIRCDPRNMPSAAIPRRLGYRHVATLEKHSTVFPGEPRDTMVWELTRQNFL
jgi:Acetyltransferases, including N-acetylases of ribosomal proteins